MAYLLDTNVFIEAKNLYYGFDFCPAFWDWLIEQNAAGNVFSIEKVADELQGVADDLSTWSAARGDGFFLPAGPAVLSAIPTISAWLSGRRFEPRALHRFEQLADFYLVAQAFADGLTVVTLEVPSGSTRKVKIPDVCLGVGVKVMTTFQMLRKERARFVLEARR